MNAKRWFSLVALRLSGAAVLVVVSDCPEKLSKYGQWWATPAVSATPRPCNVESPANPNGFGLKKIGGVVQITVDYHPVSGPRAPEDNRVSTCVETDGPPGWVRQEYHFWHVEADAVTRQSADHPNGCAATSGPCDITGIRICHDAQPPEFPWRAGWLSGDCPLSPRTEGGGCAVCQQTWIPE